MRSKETHDDQGFGPIYKDLQCEEHDKLISTSMMATSSEALSYVYLDIYP